MNKTHLNKTSLAMATHNNTWLTRIVGLALAVGLALSASPASAGHVVAYVLTDHLGSPVIEMDISGQVLKREVYGPYGQAQISPNNSGIGYTGHMQDGDTGLTYMQARYFDPEAIRFLSTDPVRFSPGRPSHFNPYWYAEGNPYKYTDPDGEEIVIAAKSMSRVSKGMELLASTPSGRDQINRWKNSKVVIGFSEHPAGKNSVTYAGASSGYNIETTSGNVTAEVVIYMGPEDEEVYIDEELKDIDDGEVISHEGDHVDNYLENGYFKGNDNCGENCVNKAEKRAVEKENKYRKERGLEGQRTRYQGNRIQ